MTKKPFKFLLGAAVAAAMIASCNDDPSTPPEIIEDPEFAIIVGTDNGRFILPVDDLMSGTISPVGKGTDVSTILTWEENVIQKERDIYHVDPNAAKFGKYRFEDGVLKTVQEIPFSYLPSLYIGWHAWIDDEQLILGPRGDNFYAIVNVKDMVVTKSGEFDRTGIPADHVRRVYSVIPKGDKLLLGYALYDEKAQTDYNKSYLAVLDFPSLENLQQTSEDDRSAPIGALRNGYFANFAEGGNTYILTHPIPLGANKPDVPTGFFRVKDGSNQIDPDYFFDVSALRDGDQQLGVAYLGNGKALLISAHDTKTNVKEWNDWWYAAMWQYLVVDVNTQKVVNVLDFPLLGNSRSAVVHNGKAYIAVNDPSADAVYIWEYDSNTNQLTRGAKVDGADNDTPMLYKLN